MRLNRNFVIWINLRRIGIAQYFQACINTIDNALSIPHELIEKFVRRFPMYSLSIKYIIISIVGLVTYSFAYQATSWHEAQILRQNRQYENAKKFFELAGAIVGESTPSTMAGSEVDVSEIRKRLNSFQSFYFGLGSIEDNNIVYSCLTRVHDTITVFQREFEKNHFNSNNSDKKPNNKSLSESETEYMEIVSRDIIYIGAKIKDAIDDSSRKNWSVRGLFDITVESFWGGGIQKNLSHGRHSCGFVPSK